MDNTFNQLLKSITLSLFILLGIGIGYMESHGGETSLEQATFYVY